MPGCVQTLLTARVAAYTGRKDGSPLCGITPQQAFLCNYDKILYAIITKLS